MPHRNSEPSSDESRWFARLLEAAPDALVIVDDDGIILRVNAETERLFGHPRGSLIGRPIEFLVPSRFHASHTARRRGFLGAPTPRPMGFGQQVVALHADGHEFDVDITLSSFTTEKGMIATAAIRGVDDPEDEATLREVRDLFGMAFDFSPLGMILADIRPPDPDADRPRTFKLNKAFADMVGYTVEELLSSTDQSRYTHPDDRALDSEHLHALVAGEGSVTDWEKRYIHADGHTVWAHIHLALLRAPDGTPRYIIGQIQDVTDRRQMEMQLVQLATRDELTGLLNRRALEAVAEEQLARCRRYGEHAAVMVLDLNGLKMINDRHGHAAGDRAIRAVAEVIARRTRAVDTAGRLGGDEFAVLLPHTSLEHAWIAADHIRQGLGQAGFQVDGETVEVAASIGCALMSAETPDIETAFAEADREMYLSKRSAQKARTSGGAQSMSDA